MEYITKLYEANHIIISFLFRTQHHRAQVSTWNTGLKNTYLNEHYTT